MRKAALQLDRQARMKNPRTYVAYSPAGTATSIAAETMRSMRAAINHRNTALASAKKNQHLEDMAIKHVGIDDRILNGSRNERKEML